MHTESVREDGQKEGRLTVIDSIAPDPGGKESREGTSVKRGWGKKRADRLNGMEIKIDRSSNAS